MSRFLEAIAEQIIGDPIWIGAALVGQMIFGTCFLVQWIASE